jgi:glyoxylase-like metal-dependent hydrolase (beta-lactamase superfamily II)
MGVRRTAGAIVRVVGLGGVALGLAWLTSPALAAQSESADADIRVLPIRGNVYLIAGGGANVVASVGKDGVLLVDSGSARASEAVLRTVEELSRRVTASPQPAQSCVGRVGECAWWSSSELLPTIGGPRVPRPLVGIVNTSGDPDHAGGNAIVGAAGRRYGFRDLGPSASGAWILAHERVARRLVEHDSRSLPTETYFGDQHKLNFFNGEGVVVFHHPAAHTGGDSMVYFRGSDVLAAGDIVNMAHYPVIDVDNGGSIEGAVEALNRVLDLAVVEHMMEGGTMVVPGHGRIADAADVAYYRDMVTILRDRVRVMSERGMTLAQIQAARPTRDYDGRFGKNPAWTPEMFVEAIHRTLDRGR